MVETQGGRIASLCSASKDVSSFNHRRQYRLRKQNKRCSVEAHPARFFIRQEQGGRMQTGSITP